MDPPKFAGRRTPSFVDPEARRSFGNRELLTLKGKAEPQVAYRVRIYSRTAPQLRDMLWTIGSSFTTTHRHFRT